MFVLGRVYAVALGPEAAMRSIRICALPHSLLATQCTYTTCNPSCAMAPMAAGSLLLLLLLLVSKE